MLRKNAQGAAEFMIILGAILFFFVAFFAVIHSNIEKKNSEKERVIIQNIALDVQDEINIAAKASEGYEREFKIPENVLGREYNINITENFVYVSSQRHAISYKIPEINGSIKKGSNIIKKQNGTIYLN